MKVLVLYDSEGIKAWLYKESIETVREHIENGYPHLKEAFHNGLLKAVELELSEEDAIADKFKVTGSTIKMVEI